MISKITEYYPLDLNTFIGNKKPISYFRSYIEKGGMSNFVVYGIPGVGKSTFANLLAKEISDDVYVINLAKNYLSGDYSDLLDIFNSHNKRVLVLENAKHLSLDYLELFQHYFTEDTLLTTIFVYKNFEDIQEEVKGFSVNAEITKVTSEEIHAYVSFINECEGWNLSGKVLEDITIRSSGYMAKLFQNLQDVLVLGLFNEEDYFKHFAKRFDQHYEELIYYIRDKKRVASILEYLLTRFTSQDIYRHMSEYCLFYFEQPESRLFKKLGNRLLVYSKELIRLSNISKTVTELYCDIYLLEAFVADNPEYKSIVDMSSILPETERERRQAHVIKLTENVKKTEDTKNSVNYLSAEELAKIIGASVESSMKEGLR